jgi:hypothetical protein
MEVRGLVWLGVRTSQFQETARFHRDVLGLSAFQEDATSVRFRLPNRTEIHVYGPADEDHRFFGSGPVVGILVYDVGSARPGWKWLVSSSSDRFSARPTPAGTTSAGQMAMSTRS